MSEEEHLSEEEHQEKELPEATKVKVEHKRGKRRLRLKVRKARVMSPEDIQSRYEEHQRRVNEGGK